MNINNNDIKEDSQSVQSHLTILQNVIQRMASNSSSSKAWCITLVSAILIIVVDKGNPNYVLIALIPNFLFFVLDAYYLSLEKRFRKSYNNFIKKLHNNEIEVDDLFAVNSSGKPLDLFKESIYSFSIWPFYLTMFLMVIAIRTII